MIALDDRPAVSPVKSKHSSSQLPLPLWLTVDYHSVNMSPTVSVAGSTRETFVP